MSTKLALRANWVHPPDVERWLSKMVTGTSLNVCCGMSRVGDVRVDISEGTNRTEAGDLFNLRFLPLSFDTVICDPPFEYYNRFKWAQNLGHLARKRLILSVDRSLPRLKRGAWKYPELYAVGIYAFPSSYIRLYLVWNRHNEVLEAEPKQEQSRA